MPVLYHAQTTLCEHALAGIARLDPNDPNSVELPLPNADEARAIAVAHLDYYRKNPQDEGTIKPFTEDGMAALLKNSQHPRILLTTAASVVSSAADEGLTFIDAPFVERAIEVSKVQPVLDFTEGIDGAV